MFGRIKSEFQCLVRKNENFNFSKDMIRLAKFGRIRPEFQCL